MEREPLDDPHSVLLGWVGRTVEVILSGKDSGQHLARFEGTLEPPDGGSWSIDIGGPEAWIALPHSLRSATLVDQDVLILAHQDGETVVRLPREGWSNPGR